MFDLSQVGFVKRIVVGNTDPENMLGEAEIQQAADLLNRCLSDAPRGHIIATEKNFSLKRVGEHQVVAQSVVYHVGFTRKPHWLD